MLKKNHPTPFPRVLTSATSILFIKMALVFGLIGQGPQAFGYGLGISSFPYPQDTNMITTELIGHVSKGKGMGLQARYGRKFGDYVGVDAGIGFSDSRRARRMFLASDIEIFPDYEQQPRISLRPFFEYSKEYGQGRSILGLSPVFSKGFEVENAPLYPFIGLPVGLALKPNRSYELRVNAALGVIGKIPFEGFEKLLFNLEGNVNIAKSYSSLFLGFTHPLN